MKKKIAILLTTICVTSLALCGCGNSGSDHETKQETLVETSTETTETVESIDTGRYVDLNVDGTTITEIPYDTDLFGYDHIIPQVNISIEDYANVIVSALDEGQPFDKELLRQMAAVLIGGDNEADQIGKSAVEADLLISAAIANEFAEDGIVVNSVSIDTSDTTVVTLDVTYTTYEKEDTWILSLTPLSLKINGGNTEYESDMFSDNMIAIYSYLLSEAENGTTDVMEESATVETETQEFTEAESEFLSKVYTAVTEYYGCDVKDIVPFETSDTNWYVYMENGETATMQLDENSATGKHTLNIYDEALNVIFTEAID